jgi:hypothetical protein
MRPLTHDDPHAIPRNGTDVPWVDLPNHDAGEHDSREAPPSDASQRQRPGRNLPRAGQRGM